MENGSRVDESFWALVFGCDGESHVHHKEREESEILCLKGYWPTALNVLYRCSSISDFVI